MSQENEALSNDNEANGLSAEDKARAGGWVSKDEWRGDPERWVDAEAFNERGENVVPILRERTEALQRKVVELERSIKQFSEYHSKVEQRAYERAVAQVKREMKEAVKVGDEEAFDQAQRQYEQLAESYQKPQEPQAQESPDFIEWKQDNTWYGTDKRLTAAANGIAEMVAAENPGLKGKPFLKEVERQLKEEFPHKFQNARRDGPAAVHGSEGKSGAKPNGKGYRDLPPEARQMCDSFVKQGWLTKEQYVKDFFGA